MKIINIMLGSDKGGLEQMALVYAKALQQNGHETTSILISDSPYKNDYALDNLKVKTINSRNNFNLFNTYKLVKYIKENKTDIVICHGNRAMQLVLNKFIKIISGASFKTLGVIHSKNCKYINKLNNIIYLTENAKNQQLENIKNNSFVLPNAILCESKNFKPVNEIINFGAMGRLHHIKGYDNLLKSIQILKNKGYKFKLVLAGDGPEKNNLLQQIKDYNITEEVEYMGWTDDKNKFFDKIDVFCMSSRFETMGLTVLESFAYSKAVISTDIVGPKSVLENLENPLIAELDNPDDFSRKMEYLINNHKFIEEQAKEGNKLFEEKYSFNAFCINLNKIIGSI